MANIDKYIAEQQSRELADQIIRVVNINKPGAFPNHAMCLVTSFQQRSDLPLHTSLIKMSRVVENNLKAIGLNEPVSLRLVQDKWWLANVDASVDNPNFESGGCMATVIGTTEYLARRYWDVYCEFTHGPYGSRDEIDGICLVTESFDRSKLGAKAAAILIPGLSARRLEEQGIHEPFPSSLLEDKWWVCGMGGGICSTKDLPLMIHCGRHVTDGPFDSKAKAEYQFDCLWESPE
ncbi:MAG: hypothetical protein Q8M20_14380 [Rhodocyclaceae bacterium]|nr:hypothetical protein [Rhodocyclaceae bacterium]MDZ4216188.1 hypothetical protein [Rhodocyclaceae bacterium]